MIFLSSHPYISAFTSQHIPSTEATLDFGVLKQATSSHPSRTSAMSPPLRPPWPLPGRVSPSVLSPRPRLLLNSSFGTLECIYKTVPPPAGQAVPLGGWNCLIHFLIPNPRIEHSIMAYSMCACWLNPEKTSSDKPRNIILILIVNQQVGWKQSEQQANQTCKWLKKKKTPSKWKRGLSLI